MVQTTIVHSSYMDQQINIEVPAEEEAVEWWDKSHCSPAKIVLMGQGWLANTTAMLYFLF